MKPIEGNNMTNVNQTALELYVVPGDKRHEDDNTYRNPQVNFTWYTKSFVGDELRLKVDFD